MNRIILIFVLLLYPYFSIRAQDEFELQEPGQIIPPSPTAASLGNYGGINVGMHTGTPNISIPLHVFKTKHLAVPITLNYSSNGVKVDQISSWVGMGWNLDAGGVITRTVMDKPDESIERNIPNVDQLTTDVQQFFYDNFRNGDGIYDFQPDVFTFNFPGGAGNFVMSEKGDPVQIPLSSLLIACDIPNNKFTITDNDGIRYIFGEGSYELSRITSTCGKTYEEVVPTAWYLKKIIHPQGDTIQFNYTVTGYSYYSGVNQTSYKKINPFLSCNGESVNLGDKTCLQNIHVTGLQLDEISSTGFGKIKFVPGGRDDMAGGKLDSIIIYDRTTTEKKRFYLDYLRTRNQSKRSFDAEALYHRIFLKRLVEYSPGMKDSAKIYGIEYNEPEQLPSRLSYSQDHWGYYNGKSNLYFIPNSNCYNGIFSDKSGNRDLDTIFAAKGLLEKIIYPTGGFELLEYEPNFYYGQHTNFPPLQTESYSLICTEAGGVGNEESYTFTNPVDQEVNLILDINYLGEDPQNADLTHSVLLVSIMNLSNSSYILQNKRVELEEDQLFLDNITMPSGEYSINLKLSGLDTEGRLTIKYYATQPEVVMANIPTGGMRIKKVTTQSGPNDGPIIKRYHYNKYSDLNQSSGTLNALPVYCSEITIKQCCEGIVEKYYDFAVINSNSINSLYLQGSNNIYYPFVTVSDGANFENGGTEYTFQVSPDLPGRLFVGQEYLPEAPRSNYGFNNGLLLEERAFKVSEGTDITVKHVKNYYQDYDQDVEVRGLYVKKLYDNCGYMPTKVYYLCNEEDVNTIVYSGWKKVGKSLIPYSLANAFVRYISFNFLKVKKDIAYIPPCFGRTPGDTIFYYSALDNLAGIEYKYFSKMNMLDSLETTVYDENGNNPIKTVNRFEYHPFSLQNIKSKTTDSKGLETIVERKHMMDYLYGGMSACFLSYLGDLNGSDSIHLEGIKSCKQSYDDPIEQKECLVTELEGKFLRDKQAAIDFRVCEESENDIYKSLVFMQDRHMLNPLIEKYSYLINKQGDSIYNNAQLNIYGVTADSLLNQLSVQTLKLTDESKTAFEPSYLDPADNFIYNNNYEEAISFNRYDDFGNLLEYTTQAGITVSIIWSYNNNFPVAKIVGAGYTTIEELSGFNLAYINENYLSDEELRNELAPLLSLDNLMVSYYTYDPAFGITSQTDPNGQTTTYEYDLFGRLSVIRDNKGKILQRIKYKFKN